MLHEHIPEADLAQFVFDADSVPQERRAAIDRAIAECALCRGSVEFFAVIGEEDLADLDVWQPTSEWSNDDPMRAYVERIAAEDREADELLDREKLLASSMRTAWRNLQRNKRLLTGGVVRRLSAHAHSICESEPLDALTFADAAISISEVLPDDTYPWSAVFELRGTAWKERANALMVLGEYPSALEALIHAERAYRHLKSPGFGLSSVALVRASILYEQGRLREAIESVQTAEQGFAHLGQEERRISAVFLRGSIKFEAGDIVAAALLFDQVLKHGAASDNLRWKARASYAIGNCEIERGNLAEASMHFRDALVIFREIGPEWDRLATEWGIARVILHGGDRSEAIRRLKTVAAGYESRSMTSDAALVWLDVVDGLLALRQTKQVVEICTRLFRIFKDAGMITGALTAAAYLKDAAAANRLTPNDVNAVRVFLRRARRHADLVFEPPPDTFR